MLSPPDALWAISHLGRFGATDPEGMLRRNRRVGDDDVALLTACLGDFGVKLAQRIGAAPENA